MPTQLRAYLVDALTVGYCDLRPLLIACASWCQGFYANFGPRMLVYPCFSQFTTVRSMLDTKLIIQGAIMLQSLQKVPWKA